MLISGNGSGVRGRVGGGGHGPHVRRHETESVGEGTEVPVKNVGEGEGSPILSSQ